MVATHNINFIIEASVFLCLHIDIYSDRDNYFIITSLSERQRERERETERGMGGERPREEINSYILWS